MAGYATQPTLGDAEPISFDLGSLEVETLTIEMSGTNDPTLTTHDPKTCCVSADSTCNIPVCDASLAVGCTTGIYC
jgi:hypothetical protein